MWRKHTERPHPLLGGLLLQADVLRLSTPASVCYTLRESPRKSLQPQMPGHPLALRPPEHVHLGLSRGQARDHLCSQDPHFLTPAIPCKLCHEGAFCTHGSQELFFSRILEPSWEIISLACVLVHFLLQQQNTTGQAFRRDQRLLASILWEVQKRGTGMCIMTRLTVTCHMTSCSLTQDPSPFQVTTPSWDSHA